MPTTQQIVSFGNKKLYLSSFYNFFDGKTGIIKFSDHTKPGFNPFPGFRPYNISEANLFFGRDDQIAQILEKLERNQMVLLHSNTEGGKTSLVEAGLIPSLMVGDMPRKGINWKFAVSKPGNTPLENLTLSLIKSTTATGNANDLSLELSKIIRPDEPINSQKIISYFLEIQNVYLKTGQNFLVVVDQLEEIFCSSQKNKHSEQYLELISTLFSLRTENTFFLIICDSRNLNDCEPLALANNINNSLHLLPNLEKMQTIYAINGSLEQVKKSISPGLVRAIIDDVQTDFAPLSVLQFILKALTETATGPVIDFPNYFKMGCAINCFNNYIKDVIQRLDKQDLVWIEKIFSLFKYSNFTYGKHSFDLANLNPLMGKNSETVKKCLFLLESKGLIRNLPHLQRLEIASVCLLQKTVILKNWIHQVHNFEKYNFRSHDKY